MFLIVIPAVGAIAVLVWGMFGLWRRSPLFIVAPAIGAVAVLAASRFVPATSPDLAKAPTATTCPGTPTAPTSNAPGSNGASPNAHARAVRQILSGLDSLVLTAFGPPPPSDPFNPPPSGTHTHHPTHSPSHTPSTSPSP